MRNSALGLPSWSVRAILAIIGVGGLVGLAYYLRTEILIGAVISIATMIARDYFGTKTEGGTQ